MLRIRSLNISHIREKKASVMMVSVILAGVLLLIGLALSELVSREIRGQQNVVQAGRAYYAAEGGVESALLNIKNNLPGYQTKDLVDGTFPDSDISYKYSIEAQGIQVPCPWSQAEIKNKEWRVLNINESVTIPFYKYTDGENVSPDLREGTNARTIPYFKVQFIVHQGSQSVDINKLLAENDVLRWKIVGMNEADGFTTEALGDYVPVKEHLNTYADPMEFCTTEADCYKTAKFYKKGPSGIYELLIDEPIHTFLTEHYRNYLVLTNVLSKAQETELIEGTGKIEFRIVKEDGIPYQPDFVCEYARVKADGYALNYKQSLNAIVKIDSFLPVFDFALYRTTGN